MLRIKYSIGHCGRHTAVQAGPREEGSFAYSLVTSELSRRLGRWVALGQSSASVGTRGGDRLLDLGADEAAVAAEFEAGEQHGFWTCHLRRGFLPPTLESRHRCDFVTS